MRTTIDIPDTLFRAAKAQAALQGRSLKSLFLESLERSIENPIPARKALRKARFPLIPGASRRKVSSETVNRALEAEDATEARAHARFVRR